MLKDIYDWVLSVSAVLNIFRCTIGLSSLYGIYSFFKNHLIKKKVSLSIGTFKVNKKDYTVQNITNIVSANFYEGGLVPDNIRKEIILLTSPKITHIKKK